METEENQALDRRTPSEREEAALRLHFHLALAGIVVPFAAFLLSGALAVHSLRTPSLTPDVVRWKRRLLGLFAVDVFVLLGMIGTLVSPTSAADGGPGSTSRSGLPGLALAWAAVALLLAGACAMAARRGARRPIRFWGAFVGLLAASNAASILAFAAAQRIVGGSSVGVTLFSLFVGTATLFVAALLLRVKLLAAGAILLEPARAAALPTVVRGTAYVFAGVTRVGIILSGVLPLLRLPRPDPGREIHDLLALEPGVSDIALLVLAAVVLAPVGEEILFRGVLLPWLARFLGAELAVWASAAVFAAGHLRYGVYVLVVLVYGVVLGWARVRTGNVRASIMLHMLINGIATAVALHG